ncbi:unnamed protein product, partial [Rotaria magnacalcarata]
MIESLKQVELLSDGEEQVKAFVVVEVDDEDDGFEIKFSLIFSSRGFLQDITKLSSVELRLLDFL